MNLSAEETTSPSTRLPRPGPEGSDGCRSGWRLEWPWWAAVCLGVFLLLIRGRAFFFLEFPTGHNWPKYLPAAYMAIHQENLGFPDFRSPLYPYLLGALGEHLGYTLAGQLLSSLASVVLIFAAGLLARTLADPWAGALAAISLPLLNLFAESSRWVNLYPTLAAATALAVALAAATSRWPTLSRFGLTGWVAGLAWGIDDRSSMTLVTVGMLVSIGAYALSRRSRRAALKALVVFFLSLSIGPAAASSLRVADLRPMSERIGVQRNQTLDMIKNRPSLREACDGEPRDEHLSFAVAARPCARALLHFNLDTLEHGIVFPPLGVLAALVLCLWPQGLRRSLATVMVLVPSVVYLLAISLYLILPDRYLFQPMGLLAVIVPVGLSRAVTLCRGPHPWATAGAMLVGGVGLYASYHLQAPAYMPLERHILFEIRGRMIRSIGATVKDEDTLLDCTGEGLESAFLPRTFHVGPVNLYGMDVPRCLAWAEHPERGIGNAYLVTSVRCQDSSDCVPALVPREFGRCVHGKEPWRCERCSFLTLFASRWEKVAESERESDPNQGLLLWRWR